MYFSFSAGVEKMDSPSALSLRRLRQNEWIRQLTKEVHLSYEQFIQPLFIVEGINHREPVAGLTGTFRETKDSIFSQIEQDIEAGVRKFLLFYIPAEKKSHSFNHDFSCENILELRKRFGNKIWLAVDVCLCSATTHGHCGILTKGSEVASVDNQLTINELAKAALQFAQAGVDCVAPSDMMDGRIGAIRKVLDEKTLIMSYAAKFHSSFYGPFRQAADSAPKLGLKDRASYQIDPARPGDALASALRDEAEGADILMVKPGLPALDILSKLSQLIPTKPWAVYQVSGEFAGVELLASQSLINGPKAHVESWIAFKRAGASMIISYGARFAKRWIQEWT